MEYIIVAIICFVLGMIYNSGGKQKLDKQIMSYLKLGKRVIICVDTDATIFELVGNKIKITKAETTFIKDEPINLPIGASNELVNDAMDSSGPSESGNYNESGVAD